ITTTCRGIHSSPCCSVGGFLPQDIIRPFLLPQSIPAIRGDGFTIATCPCPCIVSFTGYVSTSEIKPVIHCPCIKPGLKGYQVIHICIGRRNGEFYSTPHVISY